MPEIGKRLAVFPRSLWEGWLLRRAQAEAHRLIRRMTVLFISLSDIILS